MQVTSIAFTAYPGDNVAKLLAFYRGVMGLKVGRAYPSEEDAQLVEFDIGNDQWFSVVPPAIAGRPAGTGSGVMFEVDDAAAMLNRVREHARTADASVSDYPSCRLAWFEDPEGNRVGLHQRKSDS